MRRGLWADVEQAAAKEARRLMPNMSAQGIWKLREWLARFAYRQVQADRRRATRAAKEEPTK